METLPTQVSYETALSTITLCPTLVPCSIATNILLLITHLVAQLSGLLSQQSWGNGFVEIVQQKAIYILRRQTPWLINANIDPSQAHTDGLFAVIQQKDDDATKYINHEYKGTENNISHAVNSKLRAALPDACKYNMITVIEGRNYPDNNNPKDIIDRLCAWYGQTSLQN